MDGLRWSGAAAFVAAGRAIAGLLPSSSLPSVASSGEVEEAKSREAASAAFTEVYKAALESPSAAITLCDTKFKGPSVCPL